MAVDGNRLVGHAAFSPVTVSDVSPDWCGLGPISVLPELQRKGIGKSLMNEGLSLLKSMGAKGCVLVGDPGYYQRFGFKSIPGLTVEGVPWENVLALPFEMAIEGKSRLVCRPALRTGRERLGLYLSGFSASGFYVHLPGAAWVHIAIPVTSPQEFSEPKL